MAEHGGAEVTMEIEIGGLIFTPGTYRSDSAINFAHGTVVTLDGGGELNPEFLFITGSTLVNYCCGHLFQPDQRCQSGERPLGSRYCRHPWGP